MIERRRRAVVARKPRRLFFHDGAEQTCRSLADDRLASREHLVEHYPEREDIRPCIRVLTLNLLRRHVLHGTENCALGRSWIRLGWKRRKVGLSECARLNLRQSKVQQLGTGFGEYDVAGLHIPVNNACAMRLIEGVGDLRGDRDRQLERERAALETAGECFAFEVLEDEKIGATVATEIVKGTDVRMIQRRDGARLAFEAFAQLGGCCHIQRKDLDGNCSIESRVAGFVNFAHAPGADEAEISYGPSRVPMIRAKEGAPASEYTPRELSAGTFHLSGSSESGESSISDNPFPPSAGRSHGRELHLKRQRNRGAAVDRTPPRSAR